VWECWSVEPETAQVMAACRARHLARNDREKGGRAGIKPRVPPLIANRILSRPKPRGKGRKPNDSGLTARHPKPDPRGCPPTMSTES
jgi:hypothetical protein